MIAYLVKLSARMGLNVPETVGFVITWLVGALFTLIYGCRFFYLLVA